MRRFALMISTLAAAAACAAGPGSTLHRYVAPSTEVVTNAWTAVSNRTDALIRSLSGTGDYNGLENRPSVNGETLAGNVDLATPEQLAAKQDALTGPQMAVLAGGPYVNSDGVIKNYAAQIYSEIGVSNVDSDGIESSIRFTTGNGPAQTTVSVKDYDSGEERTFLFPLKSGGRFSTEEQVESAKTELNARIDLIEATTKPNMNIVGSPTFREGVVSNFSANDYLMFPTQVDVGQNSVDFYMGFTTGADVNSQQNLLDSWCGLALAVQGGHLILAASSDGTSFITDQSDSQIEANSSHSIRISFSYNGALERRGPYEIGLYLDGVAGTECYVTLPAPLHPTATYWGGANPQNGVHHIFGGTINLNECRMEWNGNVVWRGYDELPTVKFDPTAETRLDTAEKIVARAAASFDGWRTNTYSIAVGSNSVASADRGIAIGFPNSAGNPAHAAGNASVAIGISAQTVGTSAFALGANAKATGTSAFAIGSNAQAYANESVQIGPGRNSEAGTLKFRGYTLVDADGRIPVYRLPAGGADVQADMLDGVYYRRLIYDGSVYYVAVTNMPPLPQEQEIDDPEEIEP